MRLAATGCAAGRVGSGRPARKARPSPTRPRAGLAGGLLALLLLVFPSALFAAAEVRILAAASLADALGELEPIYEGQTGVRLSIGFGGSGILARQIREGAPADLFLSADVTRVDGLIAAGRAVPESRRILLSNRLVLAVRAGDGHSRIPNLAGLSGPEFRRIALGQPEVVPAGAQARSCLIEAGLWEELGPRFVSTESVRAALGLLLQGAVDAAFVYRSDLRGQASLAEGLLLDESCARPLYAAVLLSGAADREAAGRVLEFLAGAEALAVFLQHGFLPPPEALPPS